MPIEQLPHGVMKIAIGIGSTAIYNESRYCKTADGSSILCRSNNPLMGRLNTTPRQHVAVIVPMLSSRVGAIRAGGRIISFRELQKLSWHLGVIQANERLNRELCCYKHIELQCDSRFTGLIVRIATIMFPSLFLATLVLGREVIADVCISGPQPWGYFTNNTIYQTTGSESITYPRFTELMDGTIIATASLSGHQPGYFPVFESKDGGATWDYISDLRDQVNGWGMSAQPALTELTEPMAGYPAGTILGSGNSWSNTGTKIDLYASRDRARTWEFVSHIAQGGRPNTTNGATPIWEPYLL